MIELDRRTLDRADRLLPAKVKDLMIKHGALVAGGFLRDCVSGEQPKDIDLFVSSEQEALSLARALFGTVGKFDSLEVAQDQINISTQPNAFASPFAWTGKVDGMMVQVVHRWTFIEKEEEACKFISAHFDWTICQAVAYMPKYSGSLVGWCSDDFYKDLAAKRLIYTNPNANGAEPLGSYLRMIKFVKRGYRIPLDSSSELIRAILEKFGLLINESEVLYALVEVDPTEFEGRLD